jgi:Uma2 family endonuclease
MTFLYCYNTSLTSRAARLSLLKIMNTDTRHFTPEEYETVSDRVEIKVEYLDGQIVPKESLDPLPQWVVEALLSPNFSTVLNYEFPMATNNHADIIRNLVLGLSKVLDEDLYLVYGQNPEIFISLSGRYRIPDVSVTPPKDQWEYEQQKITNPIVVIEVLSPSNKGDNFMQKIKDYKSIPSLQEYWLISQDEIYLESYQRAENGLWLNADYAAADEKIHFPSLEVSLHTDKIYKGVDFEDK